MKALKKDLQTVVKTLKSLTKKTERMEKKLAKLAKAQPKKAKAKTRVKAKAKARVRAKAKARPKKKSVARRTPARKKAKVPASDVVLKIVKRSRKGVGTAVLKSKTGFKDKKIRDIVYRLKKQGKIKSVQKGFYVTI